jgi:hypothetical protein
LMSSSMLYDSHSLLKSCLSTKWRRLSSLLQISKQGM